jgi:enoyl-CoA hydratase/carnithine racemase
MELKVVRYETDGGIATVTLNRPERLNTWTGRMHAEYRWALLQAEQDREVRVIVVTGAGRGFCAGADARALEGHIEKGGYDPGTPKDLATPGYGVRPEFDQPFAFHYGISKPIIAAINGPAAGVGLAIACFADLRFAAAGAKLTTAHSKLGLPAEYGLSWVLPRLVGLTHANDMLLSSRVLLAEEAAAIGLVNRVVPPEELMETTYGYARELIARVSPASMRATKRQVYSDLHGDIGTSVAESERLLREMMTQEDYREGVRAFVEKREPAFGPLDGQSPDRGPFVS